MNRSADFAAACPSQQPAGDPTTKLAVAGDRGFESISLQQRVREPSVPLWENAPSVATPAAS